MLSHEMTTSDNPINRHYLSIPLTLTCWVHDEMEFCVGIRGAEMCKVFDIHKTVGVRPEFGWEIEQKSNLHDTKTYKSQNNW